MEIRKLEIDFDNKILKINGKEFKEDAIIVSLPGPDGWPLELLVNPEKASGNRKECAELIVNFKS